MLAEGVTIRICTTTGGWSVGAIAALLRPNARDLPLTGPSTTIEVQATYATSTSVGASCCRSGGGYYNFHATVFLNPGSATTFTHYPDAGLAHEYGHVWTEYWRFMNPANGASWNAYLAARGIAGDPRVNSTYNWSPNEMAADDYRRLFGTVAAQTERAYLNSAVPDSQSVPGLAEFFTTRWAIPS